MEISRRTMIHAGIVGVLGALGACTNDKSKSSPSSTSTTKAAPSSSEQAAASTTPAGPADPLPEGIVNALVFGTDAREEGSLGGNADAIVLAQISADRTRLTLVSIARDTYVPIGNGQGKINASFAQGGTPLLSQTVSNLFGGLPIHMTAQANFGGFIAITRWLSGITVQNKNASQTVVQSTGRVVDFPAGEITLLNTDGLIYARQRKGLPLGDLDRAERHRALVTGMLRGLNAVATQTPQAFAALATNVIGNVKVTDFDAARAPDLVTPLTKVALDQVTSLMVPITGYGEAGGASVNILDGPKAAELGQGLLAGDVSGYVSKYGTDYTPGG